MRTWGVERRWQEFIEFYTPSRDDCLRMVLLNVGDRQLAEDLVAEAFTRAWLSWGKVREHPVPRAWVVRTALNAHVSWWRRRRRELTVDDPTAWTRLDGSRFEHSVDLGLDGALVAAVRALPLRQREVLKLRVLFDLDTDATATLLGIAPGTVGAHLHRALAARSASTFRARATRRSPDERRHAGGDPKLPHRHQGRPHPCAHGRTPGVPVVLTSGRVCTAGDQLQISRVVRKLPGNGAIAIAIDPEAMPPGTELVIGIGTLRNGCRQEPGAAFGLERKGTPIDCDGDAKTATSYQLPPRSLGATRSATRRTVHPQKGPISAPATTSDG